MKIFVADTVMKKKKKENGKENWIVVSLIAFLKSYDVFLPLPSIGTLPLYRFLPPKNFFPYKSSHGSGTTLTEINENLICNFFVGSEMAGGRDSFRVALGWKWVWGVVVVDDDE